MHEILGTAGSTGITTAVIKLLWHFFQLQQMRPPTGMGSTGLQMAKVFKKKKEPGPPTCGEPGLENLVVKDPGSGRRPVGDLLERDPVRGGGCPK